MKPRETRRKVFWKILRPPDRPNWEASPVLKSLTIFIAVWLHVLPKSSLIVSHSVKATKLHKAFQYIQTVGLFFPFFFFCRQLKIIARFRLALKTQPYVFRTVWLWVNIGRKIKDVCGAEGLFVSSWGLSVCYIRCVPVTLAWCTCFCKSFWIVCVRLSVCIQVWNTTCVWETIRMTVCFVSARLSSWNWTLVCCHCKCAKSAINCAPSETSV